ncbi:hypothetical protein OAK97_02425 [bacterium]|nr:hypothetical protein [bacterium]MDG1890846.1 hypothetical protein [Verrucomicrobiota bacterium]
MKKVIYLICIISSLSFPSLTGCTSAASRNVPLMVESPDFKPHSDKLEYVILEVSGEPKQTFQAELLVDGRRKIIHRGTPSKIEITANVISGIIRKTGGGGNVFVSIRCMDEDNKKDFFLGKLVLNGSRLKFGYHAGKAEVRR